MNKEQLMALGLTEEQATKVLKAHSDTLKDSYIPKSRFDEVNNAKKQLETEISNRDKQIEDLKKVDAEGLKDKIEELQKENEKATKEYESKIKQMERDSIDSSLLSTAKNIKAVKGLLDPLDDSLDTESYKLMRENQIKKLVESEDTKFLFNVEGKDVDTGQPKVKGGKPIESSGDPTPQQPKTLADAIASKLNIGGEN